MPCDCLDYRTSINGIKTGTGKNRKKKKLWFSCKLAGFYAYLYVFPTLKCDLQILSHSLIFCFLQNVFNMVVEVPRWTNAKMEVTILQFLA